MKNYVKPSIELSKFDTEEILAPSGKVSLGVNSLTESSQSLVGSYNALGNTQGVNESGNAVEFHW